MKHQNFLIALSLFLFLNSGHAQTFTINNNSGQQGIYLEFNSGSVPSPTSTGDSFACVTTSGNQACCLLTGSTFTLGSDGTDYQFNIAVGKCGSSGSAQAEFNINSTGACGNRGSICDWVDASTVQSAVPPITITPAGGGEKINTNGDNCCGVYRTSAQNCAIAPPAPSAIPAKPWKQCKCYANNFCHNIYKPQNYTVTFG
ncbi:MAG: hypothetical protein NTZ67_03285 [Gammaproteobacteria bacterium]|nr:hypothetical protein [Gammaproteobacteria bacterium]